MKLLIAILFIWNLSLTADLYEFTHLQMRLDGSATDDIILIYGDIHDLPARQFPPAGHPRTQSGNPTGDGLTGSPARRRHRL